MAVDSLADLVNAAIDGDRRVIHDPADDSYHVIDDAVRYEYVPEYVADDEADRDRTSPGAASTKPDATGTNGDTDEDGGPDAA